MLLDTPLDQYLDRRAKHFSKRLGQGRCVSVIVPEDLDKSLIVSLQRKIVPGDIQGGKLLPASLETVSSRGGKRITSFRTTREAAEALHEALGAALKEARRRGFWQTMMSNMMQTLSIMASRERRTPQD
ncbi:hypothetical protein HY091_02255 [Candidatus Kaiserbacteria bacterium]|nr:hypothetical protein [Candidatus Kaiserbacteria bacterium]